VGQRKRAVRAFGDLEQEIMLTLWLVGKGSEATIRLEVLNQRWWAKVAQQECPFERFEDLAP